MGYLRGERVVVAERDPLWLAFSTKTCPRCGAAPGVDCKRANGTPFTFNDNGYTVHHERRASVVQEATDLRAKRRQSEQAHLAAQEALAAASAKAYWLRQKMSDPDQMNVDMTFVDRYTNVHGEKYAFIQCEGERDAVIVGSETAWKYVAVVGGRTPLFLLNQGEFDWISACWRASAPLREPAGG